MNALQRYTTWARTPRIFTEGEIVRGMRGALHKANRLADVNAINLLLDALADNPRPITPEHTYKGLAWFDSMRIVQRPGIALCSRRWRDTQLARLFDRQKRDVIDTFQRFLFTGYANVGRGTWNYYVPCYRVVGLTDSFEYCYGSWQSGNSVQFIESRVAA